ncbi:TIR domain-containing protein [Pseudobutyrivibrio sp.]|uniref:TIR domain-containing protein n=1 Tax=Pseudobutyrivibrio sp. TaxID=2014367 RepID=UPI0025D2769F|nr:TIR domain-containing protein [Pseudobutyrivibrio sp.]
MKFDAFISYRHLMPDEYIAKKVHKGLETLRIPRKLQKEIGKTRINRVFRDMEELPVGSDLGANIMAALEESEYLIVISSPKTKESYWCNQEVENFVRMHGRDKVLVVLAEGEPYESFPELLLKDEMGNPVEPFAADFRGATRKEINKKAKTELVRLAAAILGVDFDDLKQRQKERKARRNMILVLGIAIFALIFGGFSAYNLARINEEYQEKLINESKVLAATSADVLETGDRKTAALIAMEGIPQDDERPLVPESLYALSKALGIYDSSTTLSSEKVVHADYSIKKVCNNYANDNDIVGILDDNGNVYVWDLNAGEMLYEIQAEYVNGILTPVFDIGFTEDGSTLVIISEDAVRGYDESGEMIYEYTPKQPVLAARFSRYNNCLAIEYASNGVDYYPDTLAVISPYHGKELAIYENDCNAPYSNIIEFDSTGALVIVGHLQMDGEENYVSVYCPSDEENYRKLLVQNDSTISLGIAYTEDVGLIIASAPYETLGDGREVTVDLQYYDLADLDKTWTIYTDYFIQYANADDYKILPLDDGTSSSYAFSIITAGRSIYIVDNATGEIVNQIKSDSLFSDIIVGGEIFIVSTEAGFLRFYIYSEGVTNPFFERKMSNNIAQICMTDTRFVTIDGASPDARIFYTDNTQYYDASYEVEGDSRDGMSSPDGKYYYIASEAENDSSEKIFTICKSSNHEKVGQFKAKNAIYSGVQFIDNDTIFVPTDDLELIFYSISSKKQDVIKSDITVRDVGQNISHNKKYFVLYSFTFADVYDLTTRKKVAHKDFAYDITDCSITSAGDYYYIFDGECRLHRIDVATGEDELFDEDYGILEIAISPDDSKLVLNCDDNKLRVIDSKTRKETVAFDFVASREGYIKFSQDGKYVFAQSSNYYFRIYDIETGSVVLLTDAIDSKIRRISYDESAGILAVSTVTDMYLIDMESVGLLAYIPSGRFFINGSNQILSGSNGDIFVFNYKDADELIKEARKRYGDSELSEEQRLIYGIGKE